MARVCVWSAVPGWGGGGLQGCGGGGAAQHSQGPRPQRGRGLQHQARRFCLHRSEGRQAVAKQNSTCPRSRKCGSWGWEWIKQAWGVSLSTKAGCSSRTAWHQRPHALSHCALILEDRQGAQLHAAGIRKEKPVRGPVRRAGGWGGEEGGVNSGTSGTSKLGLQALLLLWG